MIAIWIHRNSIFTLFIGYVSLDRVGRCFQSLTKAVTLLTSWLELCANPGKPGNRMEEY